MTKCVLKITLFLTITGIFFPSVHYGEDFQAEVILNTDALPLDAKDRVKDMKQQVEDYLNKNKFATGEIYKIKMTFQFNFLATNGFDYYDAQLYILSQRIIDTKDKNTNPKYTTAFKHLDERCSFNYLRSMPFIKNELRFDSFLSLLDYYAYMVLGYDEDSFFPKGGNKYFQKALDICNKPMSDKKGWTETGGGSKPSRLQLVQELLNSRFDNFRNAYFEYFWLGLDSLNINPYAAKPFESILGALEKMSTIKKSEVKAFNIDIFFEGKYLEICEIFLKYPDRAVYTRLSKIDPSHQSKYEEYRKKQR